MSAAANDTLAIIYRPHEHAEEYLVFVEDESDYQKWKEQPEGGKDIALARFIGNFAAIVSVSGVYTFIPRPR
jgi:hypothetical protein